jgi:hypothetical protein
MQYKNKKRSRSVRRALRTNSKLAEIQREIHKARTEALGGAEAVDKGQAEADRLRAEHDMCLHAYDERNYGSDEEYDRDDSPPVVCPIEGCGKQRLRVAAVFNNGLPAVKADDPWAQLAMSMLMGNYLR